MNSLQDTPELSFGKINIPSVLAKVILGGIIFILALPLLGDYGMWLFPVGRDVIFKLAVEFLLILALVKSAFYNPSPTLSAQGGSASGGKVRGGMRGVITFSLVLFWFVMILSAIFSVQPEFSTWGNIYKNQGLMTWAHYLLFFFLLIGFLRDPKHWQFLIHSAMFVGTLVGLIALWQTLQNGFDSRVISTLNNSNYLAAYLVLLLPITFAFFLQKRLWWLGSAAIIQFLALLATQTRGGYLGIAMATFIFAILYFVSIKKFSKKKIFMGIIMPVVILLTTHYSLLTTELGQSFQQKLPDFTDRFLNYQNIRSDSGPRLEAWHAGWQGMLARPLLGYGPENFFVAFDQFYSGSQDHTGSLEKEGSLWESWFDKAHNFIFDIGATTGFLGLFAYLMIFASAIFLLFKKLPVTSYKLQVTSIGLISALAGYLAQNLLGFDTIVSGIYLMFLLGYANFITLKQVPAALETSNAKCQMSNQAEMPKVQRTRFWTFGFWILFGIWTLTFGFFALSSNLHANILKANHQLNLAESLAQRGQIEQSFAAFERGLAYNASPINPNLRRRYAVIALAYYDAVKNRCESNKENCDWLFSDSKKYLARALVLQTENAATEWPRFTRNYIYAAQISHILGDYENSDIFFEKAIKLSPHRTSIQAEWDRLRKRR